MPREQLPMADFEGSPIAGALIMLAVQPFADDFRQQMEFAAVAFEEAKRGFPSIDVYEEARQAFIDAMTRVANKK